MSKTSTAPAFYGVVIALFLVFVVYTLTSLNSLQNRTREIPVLITRVDKVESSVIILANSSAKATEQQVDLILQLQDTVSYLIKIIAVSPLKKEPKDNGIETKP